MVYNIWDSQSYFQSFTIDTHASQWYDDMELDFGEWTGAHIE